MFSSQLGVELEKSAYFVSFVHTLNKVFTCYGSELCSLMWVLQLMIVAEGMAILTKMSLISLTKKCRKGPAGKESLERPAFRQRAHFTS